MKADRFSIAETCLKAAHDGSPAIVARLVAAGFEGYAIDDRRNSQSFCLPRGDSLTRDPHLAPDPSPPVSAPSRSNASSAGRRPARPGRLQLRRLQRDAECPRLRRLPRLLPRPPRGLLRPHRGDPCRAFPGLRRYRNLKAINVVPAAGGAFCRFPSVK